MNDRVSVDRKALENFIECARSSLAAELSEFACSRAEEDSAWHEFELGLAALDVLYLS